MVRSLPFALALLLTMSALAPAATVDPTGAWLLVSAELRGSTERPYVVVVFGDDGRIAIQDEDFAAWSRSDDDGLTVEGPSGHPFTGRFRIETLDENDLVLAKDRGRLVFERAIPGAGPEVNEASGLVGCWELATEAPGACLADFALPDVVTIVRTGGGVTETVRGRWAASRAGDAVMVFELSEEIAGRSRIREITSDRLHLETRDGPRTGRRVPRGGAERLEFAYEDFPEETPAVAVPAAWSDVHEMAAALVGVRSLEYDRKRLAADLDVLLPVGTVVSELKANPAEPSLGFTHFDVTPQGREQFAEDYRSSMSEADNGFFPRDEPWPARTVAHEDLTVPAGTFTCTVVEGFDGDSRVKLWLVEDMPGIYARIIQQSEDPFGDLDYQVYELRAIER